MRAGERLILNFHGIGEPWEGVPAAERRYWCPTVDWIELADAIAVTGAREGVRIELTFDDGNVSDIEVALPALLERGLRATFFVCAGRLGLPRYLGAQDLRDLRSAGMGVGSHGFDHVDLRRLDPAALRREAAESREALQATGVGAVEEFALPFGSYDRRVLRQLRGYRRILTSDRGLAASGRLVPRESYVRGWRPADVVRMATAGESWWGRGLRRLRTLAKSVR